MRPGSKQYHEPWKDIPRGLKPPWLQTMCPHPTSSSRPVGRIQKDHRVMVFSLFDMANPPHPRKEALRDS
jgi:hypothetical protein